MSSEQSKTLGKTYDWNAPDLVCNAIRSRKSNFKIILKTKDEKHLLKQWIDHHSQIAGLRNLIIFDNESQDRTVTDLLVSVADEAIVVRFKGFHNQVHRRALFHKLYDAVLESSHYFCLIDTDERLIWADSASRLCEPGEFVDRLRAADSGPNGVIAGVWLNNVGRSMLRFRLFAGKAEWPAGLTVGKPIFSRDAVLPQMIGHNFQAELRQPEKLSCGNLLVLHFKHLNPEQRIHANLRKLGQYRKIKMDKDVSIEAALKQALSIDLDQLPKGNPRQWLLEIHALLSETSDSSCDREIRRGEIELQGNELKYFSDEERDRFYKYLMNPGWFFAQALYHRSADRKAD